MAKNLGQILAETRLIIAQKEAANSTYSDTELINWVNDAYRQIFVALRYLPTVTDYDVSGATVTLNSSSITIEHAKIKNPDNSNKYQMLEIISLAELLRRDPDYENADSDVPSCLVRPDPGSSVTQCMLYPPPKASVIAVDDALRVYGLKMPTPLAETTDTPNITENLQDVIPHWVAYRCFMGLNDEPRSTQQLTIFRSILKAQKGVSQQFSQGLSKWEWEDTLS